MNNSREKVELNIIRLINYLRIVIMIGLNDLSVILEVFRCFKIIRILINL